MIRSVSRACTPILLVAAAACSDVAGPANDVTNLSPSEVSSLALGVSALATTGAEDAAWSGASFTVSTPSFDMDALLHRGGGPGGRGGLGLWGPRGLGVHGTTTTTLERTAPCPQGGTLKSLTEVTAVVDTAAHTGTIKIKSTDTPAACAFAVDSHNTALLTIANPNTVITVTGAPSIVTASESRYSWDEGRPAVRGRFARAATSGTQTGSFTYATSDGRSGTCVVDIRFAFNPDTRTHTVTGTFCGQAINVEKTLPGRGPRH